MKIDIEGPFERILFAARWLAAPIYFGLIFCLILLLTVFARYVVKIAMMLTTLSVHDAVLATLAFIDVALLANLVLLVMFAGYENFVSRLDIDDHVDRPAWFGKVDFANLKLKLFTSIVAITGIELLKEFMALRSEERLDPINLKWLVVIHVTMVFTTAMAALTDWLKAKAKDH